MTTKFIGQLKGLSERYKIRMYFARKLLSLEKLIFIFLTVIFAEVTALEPTITEPPAKLYEAVEGHTVSLRCRVSGAPQPQVSWLQDGKELSSDRYMTQDNGDLEITELQFTDAGRYKCIARNKLGNDSSDDSLGHLEVKSRTVITSRPEDDVLRTGSSALLWCDARADSTLELDIEWLRNGQVIDYDKDPRISSDSGMLYFETTTELDLGIYTCVAKTRLDNATSSARLTFPDVPSAPELVGVKCDQNTAQVELQTTADYRLPAWEFTIEKNTSVTPDTWQRDHVHFSETDRTFEAHSFKFQVSMNPWANYTFRVIATNKYGSSLPSDISTQRCESPADVPYTNPYGVQGHGDKPDTLVISWMPMTLLERNGPGFFYRVLWKRKSVDDEWMTHDIHDLQQTRHVVTNIPSFAEYTIKVEAHNSKGQADVAAKEITGFSGENVPLEAPRNLTVIRVIDEWGAELSWNPVPADSVRGHFMGYKIQSWTEQDTFPHLREKVVPPDVTQKEVYMFVADVENSVRVMAFNNEYDGPASEVLRFNTTRPSHVTNLEVFQLGSTGLRLVWKEPQHPYGILTGYKIYYQEHLVSQISGNQYTVTLGPRVDWNLPFRDPLATETSIVGLKPSTEYTVTISATNANGLDGLASSVDIRTGDRLALPNQPDADFKESLRDSINPYSLIWGVVSLLAVG